MTKENLSVKALTVGTHNSAKSNFKLNSVNVEIVDKFNRPLQIEEGQQIECC